MARFRFLTAGESHGPAVLAVIEGCPAGLPLVAGDIDGPLGRRQKGFGRGGRMKIEQDRVTFVSGVRGGETLGSPITLQIDNRDFVSWTERMSAAPFVAPPEPLTRPRPGHADLAGGLKYERKDLRDVLERASARETAARVAAGAVAAKLLRAVGIEVLGYVRSIGDVVASVPDVAFDELRARVHGSEMALADDVADQASRAAILAAAHDGDTLGGVVEVVAIGLPPGLGSHVQWDRKLDGRLGQALLSIPAIKGVEIGLGFEASRRRGSAVHDPIAYDAEKRRYSRPSNGAGGLEGGVTNGMPLVVRAAMKPIATLKRALPSVDFITKEAVSAAHERSDVCAVPAASVVAEAMVALVLADALLEKAGGDSIREIERNVRAFVAAQEAL